MSCTCHGPVVHHHDLELKAEHFNEGFEAAVAQGLADDPEKAQEWLAQHDAEVAAKALEDAAVIFTRSTAKLLYQRARAIRLAGGE